MLRVCAICDIYAIAGANCRELAIGIYPTVSAECSAALEYRHACVKQHATFRPTRNRRLAETTDERMSGLALIREVRGVRSFMPVALTTGLKRVTTEKASESGIVNALSVTPETAAAAGVDEVLRKPVLASDLATSGEGVTPLVFPILHSPLPFMIIRFRIMGSIICLRS